MDEPRKPFVTISLEEKLKASQYNTLPNKMAPSAVSTDIPTVNKSIQIQDKKDQAVSIPRTQLELAKDGIVTANLIEIGDKQGAILKTLTQSPQAQVQPPLKFNTTSLSLSNLPQARVRFASSISLQDRLAQTSVTNTTHLPQYFLSDLYTGFLVIPPFLTAAIQNTQSIGDLALPIDPVIILSRQDAGVILQSPIESDQVTTLQGTRFVNGQFISNTTLNQPIDPTTIALRQGTFVSNNIFQSLIQTELAVTPSEINQGSIELPIFSIVPEQGQAGELQTPLSLNSVATLQGLIIEQGSATNSVIVINQQPITEILINSLTPNIDTQFITPLLANNAIQPLSISQYRIDVLLAFALPRIKHGSANLIVEQYTESRTRAINNPQEVHGGTSPNLSNPISSNPQKEFTSPAVPLSDPISTEPQKELTTPALDPNQVFDPIKSGPIGAALGGDDQNTIKSLVTRYTTLNYGTLVPNAAANAEARKDAEVKANSARGNVFSDPLSTRVLPTAQEGTFKDFITIKIDDIQFTAYLTSFSDSISATWNDLKYVGRQDTLKQFTGATRAVSFAILLPSLRKEDLAINMKKLERVIGKTVVGSFRQSGQSTAVPFALSGNYITGPIPKVQIGNLLNAYCAFSSVKWDFDPTEATFDIDEGLPHLLKVSFDGAVLGTYKDGQGATLLNGTDGGYFGKSYL